MISKKDGLVHGSVEVKKCPFCGSLAEIGCMLGNTNFASVRDGFQWFPGEPTAWKNLMELGEPMGKNEFLKGAYMTGYRCHKCRKVNLSYQSR